MRIPLAMCRRGRRYSANSEHSHAHGRAPILFKELCIVGAHTTIFYSMRWLFGFIPPLSTSDDD